MALSAATLGALAAPATAATGAPLGPAPVVADCLVHTGPAPCIYNIGFIEMRLSRHILHVGDTLTGTYTWGLSPTRGATPLVSGVGLDRVKGHCKIPKIDLGSSGSTTCTWKATAPTNAWVTSLGINLSQNASLGSYTENDYYAILGKQPAIEGWVRVEDNSTEKTGFRPGVPNIQVKINGPRFGRSIRTNENGYFFTTLQKAGDYRVTPVLTKKYKNGRSASAAITPDSKVVHVSDNQVGRADFRIEDGTKITAKVDRASVPADGFQVVNVDVDAERFGEPLASQYVQVIPNKESVGANPQTVPVPARYCVYGGLSWPTGDRTLETFQKPFTVFTDDKGHASFSVQTGTVPGALDAWVWLQDANTGTLRTTNINDARDAVAIQNTATGTASARDFGKALGKTAKDRNLTAPGDVYSLSELLAKDANSESGFGGLAFAPVFGSAMYGVLVLPQTERISPQPGNVVTASANATVLTPEALDPLVAKLYGGPLAGGYSGWWATVLGGAMPAAPGFASWAAGLAGTDTVGWSLKSQTGVVTTLGGWQSLGYPYAAQPGGC